MNNLPAGMSRYPCCRHCAHKSCECVPPCDFEGHLTPCSRCVQEASWLEFFGSELAAVLMAADIGLEWAEQEPGDPS